MARSLCATMCLRSQCLTCVGKVGWLRNGSVRGLFPLGVEQFLKWRMLRSSERHLDRSGCSTCCASLHSA